jgi:large subunit ribosomal protein L9
VTAADIADAVATQAGVRIDRRDVHLDEPIRSVGVHEVRIKLFHEVEPVLTVEVIAQG